MSLQSIRNPSLTLRFSVSSCMHELRLNDGLVYRDSQGLPGTIELPVNHWIVDGSNEVTLMLPLPAPPHRESIRCHVQVLLRGHDDDKSVPEVLAEITYPTEGDVTTVDEMVHVRETFHVSFTAGPWLWERANEINLSDEFRESLLSKTLEFYQLLTSKDVASILQFVSERDKEHSQAFYRTLETQQKATARSFEKLFVETDWSLMPFDSGSVVLKEYCQQRLIAVEDIYGEPALGFEHTRHDMVSMLPLGFAWSTHHNDWVIVR